MIKKKQLFKYAMKESVYPHKVQPAKNFVPQWYKDMPRFTGNTTSPQFDPKNLTVKHCVPFLDGLTSGYMVPLQCDIIVNQLSDGPRLSWGDNSRPPLGVRSKEVAPLVPVPIGYSSIDFVWHMPQIISLPKGYSALFTHPLNRLDLPFYSLSAVVDADWALGAGNLPFFMNTTFEGVIPAGTPIVQILPFKRDDWESAIDESLIKENDGYRWQTLTAASGWYKRTMRKKKSYS